VIDWICSLSDAAARVLELCQTRVSLSVRSEQLSALWTVDYALELLLLGGVVPEAVWMAQRLGDWKTASALGLAYTSYCSGQTDISRLVVWFTVAADAAVILTYFSFLGRPACVGENCTFPPS